MNDGIIINEMFFLLKHVEYWNEIEFTLLSLIQQFYHFLHSESN